MRVQIVSLPPRPYSVKVNTIACHAISEDSSSSRVANKERVGVSQNIALLDEWHGTTTGYRHKCRCDECKDAHRMDAEQYRKNNPAVREKKRQAAALYRLRKPEYMVKYRADNTETIRNNRRQWCINNRDKCIEWTQNRNTRKLNQFVEEVERKVLWNRDRGVCHICSEPADQLNWHIDHIIPLSKGGEHSYANTAVSHPFCNLSKHDKLLGD